MYMFIQGVCTCTFTNVHVHVATVKVQSKWTQEEDTCTHFFQCGGPLSIREPAGELSVDVHVLVEVGIQLKPAGLGLAVHKVS